MTISTFLWFERGAEEAARHYVSLLPGKILSSSAQMTAFELAGNRYIAFNGGPHFALNPATSIMVTCPDQAEIDRLWDALVHEPSQCGWLVDRWGLSWQILPDDLQEIIADPRGMQAMLAMSKLDVAALRRSVGRDR